MLTQTVTASEQSWVSGTPLEVGEKITAKTRYRQNDQPCTVEAMDSESLTVRFEQKQRAVTPGQALVFYQDRVCLGGATIDHSH